MLTQGRYVFLPAGSPHYPFPHNLGSRDWTSDERDPWPLLGETEQPRQWSNGSYDGAMPRGVLIGSPDCIENGERYPLPVVPEYRDSYQELCFAALPVPPVPSIDDLDIRSRIVLVEFAHIFTEQYDNPDSAESFLQLLLPTATISRVDNDPASVYPGTLVAVMPQYTVVVVSGTSTPEQRALQIMYAGGGPQNYGFFGGNSLWVDAALTINDRIVAAGADPDKPILLVGYSYGGAAVQTLAGIYRFNNPNRDVRILTMGSPSPGDIRLIRLLKPLHQVHVNNMGDPVPSLPPALSEILATGLMVPEPFLTDWQAWRRPPGQVILAPDGSLRDGWTPTYSLGQLVDVAFQALTGAGFSVFGQHSPGAYYNRLKLPP